MEKKERYSKQREVILDVLRNSDSHPNAEGVYEEARKRLPRLSLGTVYRNLRFLAEKGDVQELDLDSDSHRYDGVAASHSHFLCVRCGRVVNIDFPDPDELNRRVARSTGLRIVSNKLAFAGICLECQAKERDQELDVVASGARG